MPEELKKSFEIFRELTEKYGEEYEIELNDEGCITLEPRDGEDDEDEKYEPEGLQHKLSVSLRNRYL